MSQIANIEAGAVPAHIAAAFGAQSNDDLSLGVSIGYPIISYKGKTWQVVENGERQLVTVEGTEDPAPAINAIIVRANANLNKVYYPDGYEEGSTEKPTCHSNDSITPALDAATPQSKKCAICPHNQWGSKVTDNGARGKACSDSRRMAVVPEGDMSRAMLLRVPAASLKNLLAFSEQLTKRGVPYQALVTRIGFDHTVAYPHLTFKPTRWLDESEVETVKELYESDAVMAITALNLPSAPVEEAAAEREDDFLPPGGPAPAKPKAPKARAKPEEVAAAIELEAKPKTTGFGGGKAAAAPTAETPPAGEPASTATVLAAGAMAELDKVLGEFDDGGEAEE